MSIDRYKIIVRSPEADKPEVVLYNDHCSDAIIVLSYGELMKLYRQVHEAVMRFPVVPIRP